MPQMFFTFLLRSLGPRPNPDTILRCFNIFHVLFIDWPTWGLDNSNTRRPPGSMWVIAACRFTSNPPTMTKCLIPGMLDMRTSKTQV